MNRAIVSVASVARDILVHKSQLLSSSVLQSNRKDREKQIIRIHVIKNVLKWFADTKHLPFTHQLLIFLPT